MQKAFKEFNSILDSFKLFILSINKHKMHSALVLWSVFIFSRSEHVDTWRIESNLVGWIWFNDIKCTLVNILCSMRWHICYLVYKPPDLELVHKLSVRKRWHSIRRRWCFQSALCRSTHSHIRTFMFFFSFAKFSFHFQCCESQELKFNRIESVIESLVQKIPFASNEF